MQYGERSPSQRLSGVIQRFWTLEYDGRHGEIETILPDGCPEIVFNLADRFNRMHVNGDVELQPASIFSGQITTRITIRPTGRVKLFGIRFQPAGAFALGGLQLSELTDEIPDLIYVLGRELCWIEESINEAASFDARIDIFEEFVVSRMRRINSADSIVPRVVRYIESSGGNLPIAKLAYDFNMTERRLERRFRQEVGLSPKAFSRTVRFRDLARHIENCSGLDLSDAALRFGFYDQPHMIREFRSFSGRTPIDYLREIHTMSDLFTAN